MKLVILGVGGMGAIALSKIIAQMCIDKMLSVKSSEIHGMAKKGGLVEVQMKINEGMSGVVVQGSADYAIVLDDMYLEYGLSFLKDKKDIILLSLEDKRWIINELGDIRYANTLVLGKFLKQQSIFNKEDALKVLEHFKELEKNKIALERGLI